MKTKAQKEKWVIDFLTKRFPNEETATAFFVEKRWGKDIKCTYCDSERVYVSNTKQPYKCSHCNKKFTVKTGTIMEGSHIPIRIWLLAMSIMSTFQNCISSEQLAQKLSVTQKTSWFMAQRIREACDNTELLKGNVKMDSVHIFGKERNKHDITSKNNRALSFTDAVRVKAKGNMISYKSLTA